MAGHLARAAVAVALLAGAAAAQAGSPPSNTVLLAARAAGIHVPAGYRATVWATGLEHPTAMAFGPDGRLYVTEDVGKVVVAPPGSRRPTPFLSGLRTPLG